MARYRFEATQEIERARLTDHWILEADSFPQACDKAQQIEDQSDSETVYTSFKLRGVYDD